jgi:hypothetical protein
MSRDTKIDMKKLMIKRNRVEQFNAHQGFLTQNKSLTYVKGI